jgi:hypothetical protein
MCFKSSKPTGSSTDQTRQDGAAHRAPRPKPDILSLSLSHITAATLVVVHTQLHGPKKRSIGTLKNAKIPRPKNQPCALPTWLRARECARGKRGVANGREVAATGFFVSIEEGNGKLSRRRVSSVRRESSCARRRQPWSGTCGHQPARPRAWMGPGAGHQQSCAARSALLERVRLCSRRGPRTATSVSARRPRSLSVIVEGRDGARLVIRDGRLLCTIWELRRVVRDGSRGWRNILYLGLRKRRAASRFAMRVILMEFGFPLAALLLSPAQLMLLSVRRGLRRRGLLLLRVLLVFQDDIERAVRADPDGVHEAALVRLTEGSPEGRPAHPRAHRSVHTGGCRVVRCSGRHKYYRSNGSCAHLSAHSSTHRRHARRRERLHTPSLRHSPSRLTQPVSAHSPVMLLLIHNATSFDPPITSDPPTNQQAPSPHSVSDLRLSPRPTSV